MAQWQMDSPCAEEAAELRLLASEALAPAEAPRRTSPLRLAAAFAAMAASVGALALGVSLGAGSSGLAAPLRGHEVIGLAQDEPVDTATREAREADDEAEARVGGPPLDQNVLATCEDCTQRHNVLMRDPEARAEEYGSGGDIEMELFGAQEKKFFKGARIVEDGRGIVLTMEPFEKVYLMNRPVETSTDYHDFALFQLVGNTFSVDVNMGNPGAGCGCNVAFFLVSMPSGTSNGDHYCDANCVGGKCCPEFDLMEMNIHTLQVTNHQCSDYRHPPHESSSYACDHGGSPIVKFGNGEKDFGPGWGFTIDSQRTFNFKMDFPIEGGQLKGYITLMQDGKKVTGVMDNLDSIKGPLTDGMALVLDAWHSADLMWLDGGNCQKPESCNMKETIFSNMKLNRLGGGPAPAPGPTPAPGPAPAPGPTPAPGPAPAPGSCPDRGTCGCDWTSNWGCGEDDGSECFCRCCCEQKGGQCRWTQ